jgi:hypothetical protein
MAARSFRDYFHRLPSTLIAPGDQWTDASLVRALDLGLQFVSSYYLAIRDGSRSCWTIHVCAPYLDKPEAAWFESGLPVVGYFHDRELALEGTTWMAHWLEQWAARGESRFIDLHELAGVLNVEVEASVTDDRLRIVFCRRDTLPLVRPWPILIHPAQTGLGSVAQVSIDGVDHRVPCRRQDGFYQAYLPAPSSPH